MRDVRISTAADAEAAATLIEERLVAALRTNVPPNDAEPLALEARDARGDLVAGLIGATSYGWLLVKMIWVEERLRGRGLGRQLMAAAEQEARRRGCHGAWLDTSSTRAARFYARLGYEPFATLENGPGERPSGHRRVFMRRRLAEP